MSGGSLINSIAINTRIKKIKKSLLQNYTKEKTDMIKILYLNTKIVIKNNGVLKSILQYVIYFKNPTKYK